MSVFAVEVKRGGGRPRSQQEGRARAAECPTADAAARDAIAALAGGKAIRRSSEPCLPTSSDSIEKLQGHSSRTTRSKLGFGAGRVDGLHTAPVYVCTAFGCYATASLS
jgi:hypothetical protein